MDGKLLLVSQIMGMLSVFANLPDVLFNFWKWCSCGHGRYFQRYFWLLFLIKEILFMFLFEAQLVMIFNHQSRTLYYIHICTCTVYEFMWKLHIYSIYYHLSILFSLFLSFSLSLLLSLSHSVAFAPSVNIGLLKGGKHRICFLLFNTLELCTILYCT